MSTNEPPAMGDPTPPPPPENPATVPPPDQSMAPPPPPPPPAPTASMPAPPAAAAGVPRPGELLDRGIARFIDGIILGVVFAIINAVVAGIVYSGLHSTGEILVYYAITGIIEAALGLGYFGYLESSRGQTIGKQVMKLHTYGPDGTSNPTMEQAVRRNIFYALPILLIVPVLGWLVYAVAAIGSLVLIIMGINSDPKRQHWFDKFAGGTQVMKVG
jgi:uncharacterized RDD family membrane protein YckC